MAWRNPFCRPDGNTQTHWGFTFQLTQDHWTRERCHPLKFHYDTLGEDCLSILNEIDSGVESVSTADDIDSKSSDQPKSRASKRDLYRALEGHVEDHPTLHKLWAQVNTVPDWVDWEQVQRAQHQIWIVR
jgi:hypothetical protein